MKINHKILTVSSAYLAMIIIWSTTPITIKWSSEGIGFIAGLSARMVIGTIFAVGLCLLLYKKMTLTPQTIRVYLISGLTIYAAMMLVYFGAQYINSGLVSVIYGLSPIFTSWFAIHIFASEKFNLGQFLGAIFGTAGLAIIFKEQLNFSAEAPIGIVAVLFSVMLHSIGAVWIKQINVKIPALMITSGGLLFSIPLFIISFLVFSEPISMNIPMRTMLSIVYLGVMGSVLGFMCYYYVLANLKASTVALVTLITPINALLLGHLFNQEVISEYIWTGTGSILFGLLLHQFKDISCSSFFKRSREPN